MHPVPQPILRRAARINVVAAVLTLAAFAVLYYFLNGPDTPDWDGYSVLYDDQGAWLLDSNRDPGFIWLLEVANTIFGRHGYENFRATISVAFALCGAWISYNAPKQGLPININSIVITLIVILPFVLKGFIQIREGVAFVFIILPSILTFVNLRPTVILIGLGTLVAAEFHLGDFIFTIAWLLAVGLSLSFYRLLVQPSFWIYVTLIAFSFGTLLSWGIFNSNTEVRIFLNGYGVNENAKVIVNAWKYIYWIINGIVVFFLRHQINSSVIGAPKFSYLYASSVGSALIPSLYAACVFLVLGNFETPALTAMFVRLFYSSIEFGLIIILFRGRADFITALITATMIIDRIRVIQNH